MMKNRNGKVMPESGVNQNNEKKTLRLSHMNGKSREKSSRASVAEAYHGNVKLMGGYMVFLHQINPLIHQHFGLTNREDFMHALNWLENHLNRRFRDKGEHQVTIRELSSLFRLRGIEVMKGLCESAKIPVQGGLGKEYVLTKSLLLAIGRELGVVSIHLIDYSGGLDDVA